jgi:SAM-dependent methyltransferase
VKLNRQKEHWDRLAKEDPLWAILTDPAKRNRGWDASEFFSTGVEEIAAVMRTAEPLGYPAKRRAALDFGCGVGRLTQPLAAYFDHVTGVDVSPAMLDMARQFNRAGDRCAYVLNTRDDLRGFGNGTFDFIYARNVLQHVGARHARRYVREFVRVLRPSGLALFQLASRLRSASLLSRLGYRARQWRRKTLRDPGLMYMCGVPRETVISDVERSGARAIEIVEDDSAGPEWTSFVYAVTKS